MQRLKLHRMSHLHKVVDNCVEIISQSLIGAATLKLTDPDDELSKLRSLPKIWDILMRNPVLWEQGYSILLKPEVRATFVHYRMLSRKKLKYELSRPINPDK